MTGHSLLSGVGVGSTSGSIALSTAVGGAAGQSGLIHGAVV